MENPEYRIFIYFLQKSLENLLLCEKMDFSELENLKQKQIVRFLKIFDFFVESWLSIIF